MNLLIVTGMSGAGKSQAVNSLEDLGYYCVDNIPPALIPSFVDLGKRGSESLSRLAVVTDTRGGDLFSEIENILNMLKGRNVQYKLLFLDASDDVLIRRYKENRRKHPLCNVSDITVEEAVKIERKMLKVLRLCADYIVDTSLISPAQLKEQLSTIFFGNNNNGFSVQCISFGFKHGPLMDADILIDARCLPNPFYDEGLKNLTGLDNRVKEYVLSTDDAKEFSNKLLSFIDSAVPLYSKEGKSRLCIGIGCTGGKHRSVTFAEEITKFLNEKGYNCVAVHRDINK
ncbi:MAG: RNase adapter RapZ [Ruminococcaceae bacterium]|nr:RNase adapter RapZ [Oscillospiraceae bacterium]